MKKRVGIIFLVLIFITFGKASVYAASTEDEVVYTAPESITNRTMKTIAERYAQAKSEGESYDDSDDETWYSTMSSLRSPYEAGTLTEDTHKKMTAMSNFYRWLVGVPELQKISVGSVSLQRQALVRNFHFSHYVYDSAHDTKKPADMPDELWDSGQLCTHNMLARYYTPYSSIGGWINEGYDTESQTWTTVGHRYAIISASISDLQFGYSGRVTIGKIEDEKNKMTSDFSAFPTAGYMPSELINPSASAWSVQLNKDKLYYEDISDIQITVTNLLTKKSYICTAADDGVYQDSVNRVLLFKQPEDSDGDKYNANYQVNITGLKEKGTNKNAAINYTVKFVDIKDYEPSTVKKASGEIPKYMIYKSMSDEESLKKVMSIIPKTIILEAESGKKLEVPIRGSWTLDMENSCFVAAVDKAVLPSYLKDNNNILQRIEIPYQIVDSRYDASNFMVLSSKEVTEGQEIEFRVHRQYGTSGDISRIFKLTSKSDGTYQAEKEYDSQTSDAFDKEKSDSDDYKYYHIYKKENTELKDSGEYLSVYFRPKQQEWDREPVGYVSTSVETLKVRHDWDVSYKWTKQGDSYDCMIEGICKKDGKKEVIKADKITVSNKKEVSCTEDGETIYTATGTFSDGKTVCGDKSEVIKATGHDYIKNVHKATCINEGHTLYTCKKCGDAYIGDVVPANNDHDWFKDIYYTWNETEEKYVYTCTATRYCRRNASHSETKELTVRVDKQEPTCTEEGIYVYTATGQFADGTKVEAKQTKYLTPKYHNYKETDDKESTCVKRGYKEYTCSLCGDSYREEKPLSDNHNWGEISYKWSEDRHSCEASRICKNDSTHVEKIRLRVESYVDEIGNCVKPNKYTYKASGHFADGTEANTEISVERIETEHYYVLEEFEDSTYTKKGYMKYVCRWCGDSYIIEFPQLEKEPSSDTEHKDNKNNTSSGKKTIVVKKKLVKKITITGKKTVKAGRSIKLKAKVTAEQGANRKILWQSSNKKYATVSSTGKVKAKKAGKGKKVKITAYAVDGSNKKKTVVIKIK